MLQMNSIEPFEGYTNVIVDFMTGPYLTCRTLKMTISMNNL